jgi:hypothetical protein
MEERFGNITNRKSRSRQKHHGKSTDKIEEEEASKKEEGRRRRKVNIPRR